MRNLIVLAALLLLAVPVIAQEPENPADQNWCYDPDKWEGGCGNALTFESQWMWTCGWYMAAFDRGDIPREFIATQTYCKELLPPLPPPPVISLLEPGSEAEPGSETPPFEPTCYSSDPPIFPDVMFMGLNNPSPVHDSYDMDCTGAVRGHIVIIHEPNVVTANATCQALVGSGAGPEMDESYGFPAGYRYCYAGSEALNP